MKLYLGWSGIKEDSGRREGEQKLGDRNKETSELPPKKSHLGQNNQASKEKKKRNLEKSSTPTGTLISSLLQACWYDKTKLPAEASKVEKKKKKPITAWLEIEWSKRATVAFV